jgi:hypothetical protein
MLIMTHAKNFCTLMSSRHGKVKHFQTSSLLPKKDIKSSYNE